MFQTQICHFAVNSISLITGVFLIASFNLLYIYAFPFKFTLLLYVFYKRANKKVHSVIHILHYNQIPFYVISLLTSTK